MQRRLNHYHAWFAAAALMATSPALALAGDRPASAHSLPADDTGKNVRDRDENSVTAGQQSNEKRDVEITRQIRRAIVKDKSLSTNAHNVKIVTSDRAVTLRGPVKSEGEKAAIQKKAEKVAGAGKVDNQLEIAN